MKPARLIKTPPGRTGTNSDPRSDAIREAWANQKATTSGAIRTRQGVAAPHILAALRTGPRTASDLHTYLRTHHHELSRVGVYRNLEGLERAGLVTRVPMSAAEAHALLQADPIADDSSGGPAPAQWRLTSVGELTVSITTTRGFDQQQSRDVVQAVLTWIARHPRADHLIRLG